MWRQLLRIGRDYLRKHPDDWSEDDYERALDFLASEQEDPPPAPGIG